MRRRLLVQGLVLLLATSLGVPGGAVDMRLGPSAFVADLAQHATRIVPSATLSAADRQRQLEGFVDKNFDMPGIARFVIGQYWNKATVADRLAFSDAFRNFMVQLYAERFNGLSGASFKVLEERVDNDSSIVVYTEMTQPPSTKSFQVQWRVVDSGGYRIADISIAGISMAQVQREDFEAFLQQNGGDLPDLTRQLGAKLTLSVAE